MLKFRVTCETIDEFGKTESKNVYMLEAINFNAVQNLCESIGIKDNGGK